MTKRIAVLVFSAAVLAAALAAPAQASFHLMKVREVFAGSGGNKAAYVELQMYASGQNFVGGHTVRVYDAAGNSTANVAFAGTVARGDNQSTLLVAAAETGLSADAVLPTDALKAEGGAVCFDDIDCMAWGNFTGAAKISGPAGTPAPAIPDGVARPRTIGRGCATALDSADDSDDSAADFAPVAPSPRPNSVAPTEVLCAAPGQAAEGNRGKNDEHGPQTTLRRKPPKRTTDRTPSFRFGADEAKAKFQCKLDGKRYRSCASPYTAKTLSFGSHVFRVRAVSSDGHTDQSPATYRFTVVRKAG